MPPATTAKGWIKTLASEHPDVLASVTVLARTFTTLAPVYLSSCLTPGAFPLSQPHSNGKSKASNLPGNKN
ncbi:hypothetical protein H6F86_01180 [Phormidium sp. FACHB-592]|uniref:Uncharacterized protein n=1 Tax=Stenomitos frigidus AS-A4 TaxID=2933935 RepID=A0ABV0KQJ6_9CYAN|nr:hypothetical protein [Phormidium sp. FACHB-592]MBD2072548.1 hypothetical protein [Phormidium sp. FACHB-592]